MQFAGTQPLTLANLCLPQFETRDTSRVESFVRSQRLRSYYTFASEGRAFDEPHQRRGYSEDYDEASIAPFARYQGIGFSSPILKARADKSQGTAAGVPANKRSNASEDYYEGGKNNNKVNTGRNRDVSIRCSGKVSNKLPVAKSRSSRKAPPRHNMENTTRLAARRDRKRAKRAIMDPVYASDESTKDENLNEGAKGGKKYRGMRAKKQVKISSELTLMQSFLATNIGKERLTLKPGLNMGVFNKGKASILMSTNDKKRRARNDHTFSETKFLNPGRSQDELLHLGSTSSSSCTSNDTQATREPIKFSKFFIKSSHAEHITTKKRRTGSEEPLSITEHVHKSPDIQVEAFDDGERSEIWDIELEKSLPSDDRTLLIQDRETQNIILNTHIKKTTDIDSCPDINPLETQLSSRDYSLSSNASPIRGQSNKLQPGSPPSPTPTHSASQVDSQHDLDLVESAMHQRQTDETESKCLPISHTLSFRFRPVKSTNKVFTFPAKGFAFDPAFEVDDNDAQTQLKMLILNRKDTNDGRISSEACQWNMNVPEYAEQDSPDLLTTANFNDYTLDDVEECCWQVESNPELKPPPEHHQPEVWETTTDPMQQNELDIYEIYFGDHDAPETLSDEEQECHGSLQAEEWSHIPMDDDYGDLSTDALTSQSMKDWSDLDHKVASIPESSRYIQDARGSDTTTNAFIQGRSVLFGIEEPIVHNEGGVSWGLKRVEHEVAAQLLKDHWLPQKL